MTEGTKRVLMHDDDCGAELDARGRCPKCGFAPDMQSTAFVFVAEGDAETLAVALDALSGLLSNDRKGER